MGCHSICGRSFSSGVSLRFTARSTSSVGGGPTDNLSLCKTGGRGLGHPGSISPQRWGGAGRPGHLQPRAPTPMAGRAVTASLLLLCKKGKGLLKNAFSNRVNVKSQRRPV